MEREWGSIGDQTIRLYTLENEALRVEISDYGCIIRSLYIKAFQQDVVLGFEKFEDYVADDKYIGAIVGRNANRIANGLFNYHGNTIQLAINNGPNHLHGGIEGFNKKKFEVIQLTQNSIRLCYDSPDGEENYPGKLRFEFELRLEGSSVVLEYQGKCDQDTVFNPTHHSYFNLSGEATIHQHELQIESSMYGQVDADGLTLYPPVEVDGAMDFRKGDLLSDRLDQPLETLRLARGLDHHYICENSEIAFIRLSRNRHAMEVFTDAPGAHVYTANWLDGRIGKSGFVNGARSAICFETQFYPNHINVPVERKGWLNANETMTLHTRWNFVSQEETQC